MIDIEKIQQEIVECLKPLNPENVILFGSYANGTAGEDSDIDLFLIQDAKKDARQYQVEALLRLRDLIRRYHVGFDVLSASKAFLESRDDYFYKMDILKNGKVIYAQ